MELRLTGYSLEREPTKRPFLPSLVHIGPGEYEKLTGARCHLIARTHRLWPGQLKKVLDLENSV